jgi:endonuclease G
LQPSLRGLPPPLTVEDIEKVTGEKIPVADYAKHDKLNAYWQIPVGYNEG